MIYYVINDLEWIEVIDRDSLKERHDIEYVNKLKFITDEQNNFFYDGMTYYEVECPLKLKSGNEYHIVFVMYDYKTNESSISNILHIVGIYDDVVLSNQIVSTIKDNLRLRPSDNSKLNIKGEIIDPSSWKENFVTVNQISSVDLKFKRKEN